MKKKFDQDLFLNLWCDPLGYFAEMNSTPGSVVPLPIFFNSNTHHSTTVVTEDRHCAPSMDLKCSVLEMTSMSTLLSKLKGWQVSFKAKSHIFFTPPLPGNTLVDNIWEADVIFPLGDVLSRCPCPAQGPRHLHLQLLLHPQPHLLLFDPCNVFNFTTCACPVGIL